MLSDVSPLIVTGVDVEFPPKFHVVSVESLYSTVYIVMALKPDYARVTSRFVHETLTEVDDDTVTASPEGVEVGRLMYLIDPELIAPSAEIPSEFVADTNT